jgi:hypothetical protein
MATVYAASERVSILGTDPFTGKGRVAGERAASGLWPPSSRARRDDCGGRRAARQFPPFIGQPAVTMVL